MDIREEHEEILLVLEEIICISKYFLMPKPIDEGCTDVQWKVFKGCLGALDGTYVKVRVAQEDKARYRNRKGDISVNVVGVCDASMCFSYVLTGWEGSAADSRVLRDAVCRPNGLIIPDGNYYLCDNGYTNGQGFLAPYRGVRYHLDEWDETSQQWVSWRDDIARAMYDEWSRR
ncbi:PREDICTED: uncharacterized protein LOC105955352 [Erythranthe guttata]|uniref:uncharacterized protein LOC105955352 n=1 Tax=Erythranthe guttata TaxID=4155 RepID=UPI00064DB8DC|nr:PREDICTED: uncharacterized protein LOC105955352 [Erythranthe guttata]|eukprot:XP_012834522.1 PREDICTED: uncharacterized protein LOC105955352 [Erythranthe guttata]